jgi:O-antigen/teichoic acid export membrane protein
MITVPLAMQSGRIVLAHFSNSTELASYSLAFQFYIPCFSLISTAALTLWPIFTRSGTASLPLWTKALLILGVAGLSIAIGFTLVIGPIALLITGSKLTVAPSLAVAFGCLLLVMALHQPSAMLLTSPKHLSFQAVCASIMFALNVVLSILFAVQFGAAGVVWASVISVGAAQLVPCILRAKIFVTSDKESEKVLIDAT